MNYIINSNDSLQNVLVSLFEDDIDAMDAFYTRMLWVGAAYKEALSKKHFARECEMFIRGVKCKCKSRLIGKSLILLDVDVDVEKGIPTPLQSDFL